MRVTLKQIAAEAGVAPNTVSTVLNNRKNWTSEKTRQRVFDAARRLGYRPNQMARGLRLGSYSTVGLVIPDLLNPYYASFARSLEKELNKKGFDLLIEDSEADLQREQHCLSKMTDRQIDGIVCSLMDPPGCKHLLQPLVESGHPVLCVGRAPRGLKADAFRSDFSGGISQTIEHLSGLGHSRFGFVSGLPEGQSEDGQRFRSFKNLLAKRGVSFSRKCYLQCGHTLGQAREAFHRFWHELASKDRPTAIICLNDILAIGVIRAVIENGLEVPGDLSVTGFDNTEIAAHLPIPLTTVALPHEAMASAVAERFFKRRSGEKMVTGQRETVFPTQLVVRDSSGPARLKK